MMNASVEGRCVGVAFDFSACSKKALKWAVDNIIREGDHLILIVVLPEVDYEQGEMQLWEVTGSPFIPVTEIYDPIIMKKYGVQPDDETLDIAYIAAAQKGAIVMMKIYWGDAGVKICEAVDKIRLSCLIIGNKGINKFRRAFYGSVSSYVVDNATCPVTVIKQ